MTKPHPASRVLLLYAACLAAMLVTAVTVAMLRDASSAKADGDRPAKPLNAAKTR